MRKYLIYPIKQYIFKFFTFLCCGVGCIYYITQIEEALQAGFWDVLFFLFRGQREYNPVSRQPFIPPFFWIIIQSTLIYCSVSFLSGKLSPYETQILIRMRKRKKWWREKIAAAILYTSMTYLILWAGIAASCLVSGQKLGNQGLASLYGMGNLSVSQNILVLMVQPFLTTLSFAFGRKNSMDFDGSDFVFFSISDICFADRKSCDGFEKQRSDAWGNRNMAGSCHRYHSNFIVLDHRGAICK